jgi:hypothetical protein
MTATLSLATPTFWLRLSMVDRLMMPFKDLVFITSERDCPCSAFLPLVFVLHKEVSAVLDMPAFDAALGDGAAAECRLILAPRWNMTGRPPAGRKVGFLDRHHIYMAFVDPFSGNLAWTGTIFSVLGSATRQSRTWSSGPARTAVAGRLSTSALGLPAKF